MNYRHAFHTGDEARRGGEWLTGIARVMQARFSENTLPLLAPYLDIIRAFNPQRELQAYPGSPLIARALLRPQDRLTACEIEPNARKQLIDALRRDTQARVVDLDGWTALPAFVPPNERRGLVLIDPSFEQKDEFDKLAHSFAQQAGRQMPAARIQRSAASGGRAPHLDRAPDRQPTMDAGGRIESDFTRIGKAARPGRRRPFQARDA